MYIFLLLTMYLPPKSSISLTLGSQEGWLGLCFNNRHSVFTYPLTHWDGAI